MNFRNLTIAALASLTVLGATALPASAAIISQTQAISTQTTNWNETLTFDLFDPSLGTLNSIKFKLKGDVQGTIEVENKSSDPAVITSNLQATITVTRPDLTTILLTIPVASYNDSLGSFDHIKDFAGTSGITHTGVFASSVDTITSPPPVSDLALFMGLGTIDLPISAYANSYVSGGGNLMSAFETMAGAELTIEYDYAPNHDNNVPEPATLALFATGLLGAGAFGRRRKVKASA